MMFGFVVLDFLSHRDVSCVDSSPRFSVLIGPINHIKHLVSKDRLPFSLVYLGSLGLTLYFALGVGPHSLMDLS